MRKLIDNHCHLEEISREGRLTNELQKARTAGVTGWFSSALCHEEMEWHRQQNIEGMTWCAGIHPFYERSTEKDWEFLIDLAESGEIAAIGEIGLDKRNPDWDWQIKILLKQLELAREYELPVVFHVVKSYYELNKLLKNNFPGIRGCLHGFNSSIDVFEAFSSFDMEYSLNARLPEAKVIKAVIKRGYWEIETDAPYAKPANIEGDYNTLINLIWIKNKIEEITGIQIWE